MAILLLSASPRFSLTASGRLTVARWSGRRQSASSALDFDLQRLRRVVVDDGVVRTRRDGHQEIDLGPEGDVVARVGERGAEAVAVLLVDVADHEDVEGIEGQVVLADAEGADGA